MKSFEILRNTFRTEIRQNTNKNLFCKLRKRIPFKLSVLSGSIFQETLPRRRPNLKILRQLSIILTLHRDRLSQLLLLDVNIFN